ncbi:unnamed protein product [Rhizoctonia solani]|uniref:CFEM domain-containing protein n=1 Tax=Rhizoctonia solani TaxID=456999 RepID=A0A8H3A7N0_9AGAM|nr:unnamed protein product [Rhizoctonia solani]
MRFTIAIVASLAAVALAQSVPACVKTCSDQAAAANGCESYDNLSCVCASAAFQSAAHACIQSTCTADELAQALTLKADHC